MLMKPPMTDSLEIFRKSGEVVQGSEGRILPFGGHRSRTVERRKPEKRALFLADISRILFESLDYEETLATVVRMAMPELGAWCIVDLLSGTGEMSRLAVFHPDPALQTLARKLEAEYAPSKGDILGAPRIARTQQPELIAEVSEEIVKSVSRDEQQLAILRALGFRSYMVVPLKARGRLVGAITFVAADASTRYTPRDLLFAEDLAGRAAMAMDNARLFQEAQQAREEAVAAVARATIADRVKSDFLATMSHELRTPLNAIAGYAELLEMGMRGPVSEQQREAISRIRRSQQHLLGIVNDILTFAKTETGRIPMRLENIPVDRALERVHFLVRPMLEANDIDFRIAACDTQVSVVADGERLQQILVNLLSNAAKFSHPGGMVSIKCEVREHLVALAVSDRGFGIGADKLEAVFEPFVQLSTGLTRSADGSGLGLAISRELARMMGGDVTVESQEGKGSTFTLTLPMSPPCIGQFAAAATL